MGEGEKSLSKQGTGESAKELVIASRYLSEAISDFPRQRQILVLAGAPFDALSLAQGRQVCRGRLKFWELKPRP